MNFYFRDINKENWKEAVDLRVKDEQSDFIESNALSIAESKYVENWIVKGIYLEEELIGFTMYGYFDDDKRVWLDRFMIDYKFQGKGYGKKGLLKLIEHIANEFKVKKIYLSIFENNKGALRLYEKIGFKFTGELDYGGEKVMELNL
ncbi:GNAT family N-acetyltransferase [Clostridium sp. LIBA-8841]|uniref:GNAT family N-acetyltransferase n=1 Tax=Clostridium sp. LIBA-8841 TaxID=2987530 RepID=UPI002AC6C2B1|nr:GNAT family N-acetyltransferase [Clostridium sp. LIBA-8841]MDZ5252479.1 GNAT family N-acetyltransferase [Clostridium sp. LIBA-8841]